LDRAVNVFRETGSVLRKQGSGGVRKGTDEIVANAQEIMENAPKTSIRQLSQQINFSVGTTHRMLHKNLHLYPYCVIAVQELKPADYPRRLNFCNWLVDNVDNNVEFSQIIFSDESWFHTSEYGVLKIQMKLSKGNYMLNWTNFLK
jgi:hypothetical protein